MTPNGKLDSRALRELQPKSSERHVEPSNDLETKLRAIVAELVAVEPGQVGINDDLFRLGVNSVLAIKLIARIRNEMGVEVSIATLFTYPTIGELVVSAEFAGAGQGMVSSMSEDGS